MQKNGIAVLNVSENCRNEKDTTEETQSKEEIRNFISYFPPTVISKKFISNTIRAISGYLIRRYFYPREYFKNQSFFYFDKSKEISDRENRSVIENIIKSKDVQKLAAFLKNNENKKISKNIYKEKTSSI